MRGAAGAVPRGRRGRATVGASAHWQDPERRCSTATRPLPQRVRQEAATEARPPYPKRQPRPRGAASRT
eukprot:2205623-Pleurochrysis_carterae.AAC.1